MDRPDRTASPAASLLLRLGLLAAVAAVYLPSSRFSFLSWDDDLYVTANPLVRAGLTPSGALRAFTSFDAGNWHPLTWLSHMADVSLFGLDPSMHHLVNVAIHGANALLLWTLLTRLTGALRRSALAAALFALHPLHVESVAWVSERKDLLCALFVLLALLAYCRHAERPSRGRLAAVALLFAAALMSKPVAVTFPFVMLLLDYWPLRRFPFSPRGDDEGGQSFPRSSTAALLLEKAPLFLLSAASCAVTMAAQERGRMITSLASIPLPDRLANAVAAYGFYLRKTILPTGLAAYYPYRYDGFAWPETAGWTLLLVALTAAALRERERRPYLPVGWLWFLGTLVPMIGLVQVSEQAAADRYTYLPLVGLFVALSWGAGAAAAGSPARRRAVTAVAVALLLLLVPLSRRQAGFWADSATLFRRAATVTERNHVALANLGAAVAALGPERAEEAMAFYREALEIRPGYAPASYNMGYELYLNGRPDEALPFYMDAIRSDPSLDRGWNDIGVIHLERGNGEEAARWFREALRRNPGSADAHANVALSLELAGRYGEARAHYEESLRLRPGDRRVVERLEGVVSAIRRTPTGAR